MKNIAFKRAKTTPTTKDILHPEYITEYADTSLFPEGFHKIEDGYEILSEDMFKVELAKNEQLHQEFLEKKKKDQEYKSKLMEAEAHKKQIEEQREQKEFQEFLKWKQNKGK